jgi:hypothetical protein
MFIRDGTPSGFSTMSTGVPLGGVWHIFDRHDLGDNTLVTVTTRHLVTWLETTLNSQIHLDDLQHARRQIVTLGHLLTLFFERTSKSARFQPDCSFAICSS